MKIAAQSELNSSENLIVWMTRQEVGKYLNVSPRWLASADGRAAIPHYKFGNQVRYNRAEVDRWASQQRA